MKIGCSSGVVFKNKIFFSATFINAFCYLDLNDESLHYIGIFEKERCIKDLFREAYLFKNEAWFIPQMAEHIVCVDLDSYEMTYYELPYNMKFSNAENDSGYFNYIKCLLYEKRFIYCLPRGLDTIAVIDMKNHLISGCSGVNDPKIDFLYDGYFDDNNKMVILSSEGKLDGELDLDSLSFCRKKSLLVSEHEHNYMTLIKNNNKLFLIPFKNGNILEVDTMSNERKNVYRCKKDDNYYGGIYKEDYLLLFPNKGSEILKYNTKTKLATYITIPLDSCKNMTYDNGPLIIPSENSNYITFRNKDIVIELSEELKLKKCYLTSRLEDKDLIRLIGSYKEKDRINELFYINDIVVENELLDIKDFINAFVI